MILPKREDEFFPKQEDLLLLEVTAETALWYGLIVFQVLKVLLKKIVRYCHQIFVLFLFVFISFFTSAGIIFVKFLELHSTISAKNIFVTNFPFLTDSLRPCPPPLL